MNRRKFLKRIAAVAAGAVAVPVVLKSKLFNQDSIKLPLREMKPRKGRHVTLTMWDEFANYPVGTRYMAADGRVYLYAKMNKFVREGEVC